MKICHLIYDDLGNPWLGGGGAWRARQIYRRLAARHPGKAGIARALGYFRNNRHRMLYAECRALGFPIGSGVVEAAAKTLVTQRLKRSGMRWGMEGGQAVLGMRALRQSGRFGRAWDTLRKAWLPPDSETGRAQAVAA